jgi:hypothetical protein
LTSENDQQTIEAAFVDSWNGIEVFYSSLIARSGWEWLRPIFDLIANLREQGYDRQCHAGQSHEILVLSRSRIHGFRLETVLLGIGLQPAGGMHLHYVEPPDVNIEMDVDRVEITPQMEDFLARLVARPIDWHEFQPE